MAHLVRSAKSSNDWTLNDLESYHIGLFREDPLVFFGMKELPAPSVDEELLRNVTAESMQNDRKAESSKRTRDCEPVNARAQLVAEAVEAFNQNNFQRDVAGLATLEGQVIPGIIMVGTLPAFFKIPVTQALSVHIRHGTNPPDEARVTYFFRQFLVLLAATARG